VKKGKRTILRYWANPGGDDGLRNGSFVREIQWEDGDITLSQFMNGDYMGWIKAVPEGFTEVSIEQAQGLISDCCK
jgi:hypothetical protein